MLDIGFSEILLFGIIALVVLGPEKLPIAVRTAGRWYAQFRRIITNVQHDIEQELKLAEMREQMQQELNRIKQMEHNMQQQLDQINQNLNGLNQSLHVEPTTNHVFPGALAYGLMVWQYVQSPFQTPFHTAALVTEPHPAEETPWQLIQPNTTTSAEHTSQL